MRSMWNVFIRFVELLNDYFVCESMNGLYKKNAAESTLEPTAPNNK